MNLILIYIGEIIAEILGGVLLQTFSSILIIRIMFIFCFTIFFTLSFISHLTFLSMIFLLMASFSFSMAFVASWSYVYEHFESNVKATAFVFLTNCGNLGISVTGYILEYFSNTYQFFAIVAAMPIVISFYL